MVDRYCALSNLVHLRTLHLSSTFSFDDDSLSALGSLVNLEFLRLHTLDFTGTGFRDLSGLTALHTLDLDGSSKLTDEGILECARTLTALRHLILGCDCEIMEFWLTSAAWRHLAENASPTLTHVDIFNIELTAADQQVLGRFAGKREGLWYCSLLSTSRENEYSLSASMSTNECLLSILIVSRKNVLLITINYWSMLIILPFSIASSNLRLTSSQLLSTCNGMVLVVVVL